MLRSNRRNNLIGPQKHINKLRNYIYMTTKYMNKESDMVLYKGDNGENNTACAEACEKDGHQAILFGDLNDEESDISKQLKKYATKEVRSDLGLNTAVRYRGI